MRGSIDIYQDAQGYFSMAPVRFIPGSGGVRFGEFIGTIYCDRGAIREPVDDTLVHSLDGERRPFEVSEPLKRAAKPPEELRIALDPWASQPPPVNETDLWIGWVLSEAYSTWGPFSHWKIEAVGHSEGKRESEIRSRLGLAADQALPPYCVILAPSPRTERSTPNEEIV